MSTSTLCTKCGKKLQTGSSGSVTRWLFPSDHCSCDRQRLVSQLENAGESSRICLSCGKLKGAAQAGSLTQWIFSSARCRCEFDKILDSVEEASAPARNSARRISKSVAANSRKNNQVKDAAGTAIWKGEALQLDPTTFPSDRYKPFKLLGQGALGQVYLCWDQILKKLVAVKCLLSLTEERVIAFQNEAKIAGRLKHECISMVLDFGITSGGRPFLVMEYFEGPTLQQFLKEQGRLSDKNCLTLMTTIAGGLQYLHDNGVLHKDLKPSNILVSTQSAKALREATPGTELFAPEIRLIDFGLSKSTADLQSKTLVQGKTVVGTPLYMSPDQIAGRLYDERSEIYSFGCILFETLTGLPPFRGDNSREILSKHANAPLSCPVELKSDIERELYSIAQNCLEKRAADRFQSVDSLLRQLYLLQTKSGLQSGRTVSAIHEFPTPATKTTPLIISVAVVLSLVAVASGLIFLPSLLAGSKTPGEQTVKPTTNSFLIDRIVNDDLADSVKSGIERGERELSLLTLTDDELRNVGKATSVQKISIRGSAVSDKGIGYMMPENLRWLDARGSNVSSFENIGKLKHLRVLIVRQTDITDDSLDQLKDLPSLTNINASSTALTDKAISKLAGIPTVQDINLSDTKITGRNLSELARLRRLNEVCINKTAVQMVDVKRLLSASPTIRHIDITDCPNISARQIWQLEREFPNTHFAAAMVDQMPVEVEVRFGELASEGQVALEQKQYLLVVKKFQECLQLLKEDGRISTRVSAPRLLVCYENIGKSYLAIGKYDLSEKTFRTGVLLARTAGFPDKARNLMQGLSQSYVERFRKNPAELRTTEQGLLGCVTFSSQVFGNDAQETAAIYSQLAKVMAQAGEWEYATTYLKKAVFINETSMRAPRHDKNLDKALKEQQNKIQKRIKG